MHATVSGLAEYLAEDDADALSIAREIMAAMPWNERLPPRRARPPRSRATAPTSCCGVVPVDYRKPYDVREVIARIVDDSDFLDFKPLYGAQTVCGQAAIDGEAVGIIGNNGPIDADGATKAAQFIQLCDQADTPLVFLQNTTGYMVGRDAERAGIVKHGSKMIQAVANHACRSSPCTSAPASAPATTACAGAPTIPRFIFAWPNNRIAVMGGEQAANVLAIVTEEKLKRDGKPVDHRKLDAMRPPLRRDMEKESTALFATARLWDDGLIDPRDTRRVLGFCLSICREAESRHAASPNTFGVARMYPIRRRIHHIAQPTGSDRHGGSPHEHEELRTAACKQDSSTRRSIRTSTQWEEAGIFPAHEVFKKMGDLGFLGINKPAEYGGHGPRLLLRRSCSPRTLGHIRCGGVPMAIGVQTDMATPALARFGSDELRKRVPRALDRRRLRRLPRRVARSAPAPTSPRSRPPRARTAATTSSTAARCGPPTARRPTGCACSPTPARARRTATSR